MKEEMATLAGGCFWCTEAVFQRLKGVHTVVAGYTGGSVPNPTYDQVCSGQTGHAETIQIQFDPSVISYETLLTIFFHLHDPTTRNRQGNDTGTQYRSAIFYHSEEQKQSAEKIKETIEQSNIYANPLVTDVIPFTNFYQADDSHQNFYNKNSYTPYCQVIIDPKIQKLMTDYRQYIRS